MLPDFLNVSRSANSPTSLPSSSPSHLSVPAAGHLSSLKLPVPTACFNISDKHPRHTLGECLHFRVGARPGRSAIGRVSKHTMQSNLGFFSSSLEYLSHRFRNLAQTGAGTKFQRLELTAYV